MVAAPLRMPASSAGATCGSGGADDGAADALPSTNAGLADGATTSDRWPAETAGAASGLPRSRTAANAIERTAPSPSAVQATHPVRRAVGATGLGVADVAIWCEVVAAAGGGGIDERAGTDSMVGASGMGGAPEGTAGTDGDDPVPVGCATLSGARFGVRETDRLRDRDCPLDRRARALRRVRQERDCDLGGAGVALRAVLGHAARDDVGERGGDVGEQLREAGRGSLQDGGDELGERLLAAVGRSAGEDLEERRPERPDVGPMIDGRGRAELLGRHVTGGPHDAPRGDVGAARPAERGRELRDAEVEDLDRLPPRRAIDEEEVLRFDVAVHDAARMGLGQPLARLDDVFGGARHVETTSAPDDGPEVLPLQVLHDDVGCPVVGDAEVEDARHVLALELCGCLGFLGEARQGLGVADRVLAQELERDRLVELQVRGRDDDPHPALAENTVDAKLTGDDLSRLHPLGTGARRVRQRAAL